MDLTFDESLFKKVIAVLVIAIIIVGAIATLKFTGLLGDDGDGPLGPGQVPSTPELDEPDFEEQERQVAGPKSYNWTYRGTQMEMDLFISNATYQHFVSSSYGTYEDKPQRMAEYVVTDGDDGVVGTIAEWFLTTSLAAGYGDRDTVGNVLAFVENLTYTTDEERRQTGAYPNYPAITLATQEGDSEDHTILAAAILHQMGYGVSLLYYPAQLDRRMIIPEATALGIVSDGALPGRTYGAVAETPAGKFVYDARNKTALTPLPEGCDVGSGWYSGDAVWHNATSSGSLDDVRYYPANRTFVTWTDLPDVDTIVIENAVWNQPLLITAAWTVNTTEKGIPRGAYDGMEPFFNGGDGLWQGWTVSRDDRLDAGTTIAGKQPLNEAPPFSANESLTAALRMPASEFTSPLITWLEPVQEYYADTWYPSGIAWTYDDKWHLHENILEMQDSLLENPEDYSLRGVTEVVAPVPWRVSYTVRKMDEDHTEKEMTPYSDVRFAVYRIEDGAAVFDRTFGWQTIYGADVRKNEAVFGAGEYALAVFVRNCEVDVAIEYHGTPAEKTYRGGI
ncbi:hypothetical protein RJ40_01135 [Methanofollis aquaemaris]|uniref:Uncharacterized protein n=1 Tax=Methanofollis aquaemaris TaxID=126734 RepID=A0A8A3S1E8_9EURY|nr:hypothetical protein [Methanofollis aquaemaris]QSZ66198.1 hypothetical protein RJ40_01135 [Methanofollis aquaemaris]